jgi:hypothetical protein
MNVKKANVEMNEYNKIETQLSIVNMVLLILLSINIKRSTFTCVMSKTIRYALEKPK